MNLLKKMKTPTGKMVMSIVLGIGLATLFKSLCDHESCRSYIAPKPEEVEDKVIKKDGKCYSYQMENTKCNDDSKKVLQYE